MIGYVLNNEDHKNFSSHYNKLRAANRIYNIIDAEEIKEYFQQNAVIHFEIALAEILGYSVGIIEIDKNKFVIGIGKNGEIRLFDKLSKFLKIKI